MSWIYFLYGSFLNYQKYFNKPEFTYHLYAFKQSTLKSHFNHHLLLQFINFDSKWQKRADFFSSNLFIVFNLSSNVLHPSSNMSRSRVKVTMRSSSVWRSEVSWSTSKRSRSMAWRSRSKSACFRVVSAVICSRSPFSCIHNNTNWWEWLIYCQTFCFGLKTGRQK